MKGRFVMEDKDRSKVLLVLAGMSLMGFIWTFLMADEGVLPSANLVVYLAIVVGLIALVAFAIRLHAIGYLILGLAVHMFLSGVTAVITLDVFSPIVQVAIGLIWAVLLAVLLLQARSNKLPQRG